jgi:hypothetical protein
MGFWLNGSLIATSSQVSATTIYSISVVPGNWILVGNATFAVGVSLAVLSISTTNNARDNFYETIMYVTSGGPGLNITRIASISVTTTFYLVAQSNVAASVSSTYIQAMRVG